MSNIVIFGLDRLGTALGTAVREAVPEWTIWGADVDRNRMQRAKKSGAVEEVARNLRQAVEVADILIINTNIELRETLFQNQGKGLKEDAIVIDLAVMKARGLELARQHIPSTSYVGVHIVVNPMTGEEDTESTGRQLLAGSIICIIVAQDTDERALQWVESLAGYLQSFPLFLSTEEFDGLRQGPTMLSLFAATSQLKSMRQSAGWKDLSRLAGPDIIRATSSIDQEDLIELIFADSSTTIYWLDQMISELMNYKSMISNDDREALNNDLLQLREDRAVLSSNIKEGAWTSVDEPNKSSGASFGKLMLGRIWRKDEQRSD